MGRAAWVGLLLGVGVGAAYVALQALALKKRRASAALPLRVVAGAALRLVVLVGALLAIGRWTDADPYWLTGGLAITYGMGLLWTMTRLLSAKK